MEEVKIHNCFNCSRSENEIPLINLSYAGKPQWVCSQCLPVVIHHLEQVQQKLDEKKN